MTNIIQDIRKRCRMAMNGITSANMRQYGLNYKLNFGVSIPQIREIAKRYEANKDIAETLWADGTRELKILATLLYPLSEFDENTANLWAQKIINQEIREQLCLNLLQNLSFAKHLALAWSNNEEADLRTTGYWLASRCFIINKIDSEIPVKEFNYILSDVMDNSNISLRNAANLLLKNLGKQGAGQAQDILLLLKDLKYSDDLIYQEIYDSLQFEFEYHHNG